MLLAAPAALPSAALSATPLPSPSVWPQLWIHCGSTVRWLRCRQFCLPRHQPCRQLFRQSCCPLSRQARRHLCHQQCHQLCHQPCSHSHRPLGLRRAAVPPVTLSPTLQPGWRPCRGLSYAVSRVVNRAANYATNCSVHRAIGRATRCTDRCAASRTAVPSATLSTVPATCRLPCCRLRRVGGHARNHAVAQAGRCATEYVSTAPSVASSTAPTRLSVMIGPFGQVVDHTFVCAVYYSSSYVVQRG